MSDSTNFSFSRRIDGDYVTLTVQRQENRWILNGKVLGNSDRVVTIDNLPEITDATSATALTILRNEALYSVPCSTASHLHLRTAFRPWTLKNSAELAERLLTTSELEDSPLVAIANELFDRSTTLLELLPLSRVSWLAPRVCDYVESLDERGESVVKWMASAAPRWSNEQWRSDVRILLRNKIYGNELWELERAYLARTDNVFTALGEWLGKNAGSIDQFCQLFLPSLLVDYDSARALRLLDFYITAAQKNPKLIHHLEAILDCGSASLRNKIHQTFPALPMPGPRNERSTLADILEERYAPQIAAQRHVDYWQTVFDTYIPLQGVKLGHSGRTDLEQLITQFLRDSTKQVALLHGDLGSGKTTFCRHFGQALLDQAEGDYLPIFVNANRDINPDGRWVSQTHDKIRASIQRLGKKALLIIDSCDELKYDGNLFNSLQLDQWDNHLKVLIAGRPQYTSNDENYQNRFAPVAGEAYEDAARLAEFVLKPFDDQDVCRYLVDDQHSKKELRRVIGASSGIRSLLRRPFALAQFAKDRGLFYTLLIYKLKPVRLSDLLRSIVIQRLKREEQRIYARGASGVTNLNRRLQMFNRRLAFLALSKGTEGTFELPDPAADNAVQRKWAPFTRLFSEFPRAQEGGLYGSVGPGRYSFLDPSLLGYFGAQHLFNVIEERPIVPDDFDAVNLKVSNWLRVLLAEMIAQSPKRSEILEWLTDLPFMAKVAARDIPLMGGNALSLLTAMRIPLSRLHLSGCVAEAAYLAGAAIDGTDLRNAQLSHCDLNSVFIRNVNLQGAKVSEEESPIDPPDTSISLSEVAEVPSEYGDRILLKDPMGGATIWDTMTKRLLWKHSGVPVSTTPDLSSVTFEKQRVKVDLTLPTLPTLSKILTATLSETRIATGHSDGTIWIWESTTARSCLSFTGHQGPVTGIGFLGDHLLASVNGETLLLWKNGESDSIDTEAHCLATSEHLVLCGQKSGFGLWELIDDKLAKHEIWGNHGRAVLSVAFSSNGKYFSAGADDGLVSIWDAQTLHKLRTVSFSPNSAVKGLVIWGSSEAVALSVDGNILRSQVTGTRQSAAPSDAIPIGVLRYGNGKAGILVQDKGQLFIATEQGERRKMEGLPITGFNPHCSATDGRRLVLGGESLSLWDITNGQVTLIWRTNPERFYNADV